MSPAITPLGGSRLRALAALGAALALSGSAPPGRILFISNRDGGDIEIYSMRPDGSGQTRLTRSRGIDNFPAWSPDRRRIAFESDRAGQEDVYVMNADGSGVRRLTRSGAADASPRWR